MSNKLLRSLTPTKDRMRKQIPTVEGPSMMTYSTPATTSLPPSISSSFVPLMNEAPMAAPGGNYTVGSPSMAANLQPMQPMQYATQASQPQPQVWVGGQPTNPAVATIAGTVPPVAALPTGRSSTPVGSSKRSGSPMNRIKSLILGDSGRARSPANTSATSLPLPTSRTASPALIPRAGSPALVPRGSSPALRTVPSVPNMNIIDERPIVAGSPLGLHSGGYIEYAPQQTRAGSPANVVYQDLHPQQSYIQQAMPQNVVVNSSPPPAARAAFIQQMPARAGSPAPFVPVQVAPHSPTEAVISPTAAVVSPQAYLPRSGTPTIVNYVTSGPPSPMAGQAVNQTQPTYYASAGIPAERGYVVEEGPVGPMVVNGQMAGMQVQNLAYAPMASPLNLSASSHASTPTLVSQGMVGQYPYVPPPTSALPVGRTTLPDPELDSQTSVGRDDVEQRTFTTNQIEEEAPPYAKQSEEAFKEVVERAQDDLRALQQQLSKMKWQDQQKDLDSLRSRVDKLTDEVNLSNQLQAASSPPASPEKADLEVQIPEESMTHTVLPPAGSASEVAELVEQAGLVRTNTPRTSTAYGRLPEASPSDSPKAVRSPAWLGLGFVGEFRDSAHVPGGEELEVLEVEADTPASVAGIQPRDVIQTWDDMPLSNESAFEQALDRIRQTIEVGQQAKSTVRVLRGQVTLTFPIVISPRMGTHSKRFY